MALTLKTSMSSEWYMIEGQEGEDEPARVKIKPLNGAQVDQAMEGAILEGDAAGLSARGIKYALQNGIDDWENVNDESGEIECKPQNYARLPWSRRVEIANAIINRSNLSEEDQKN